MRIRFGIDMMTLPITPGLRSVIRRNYREQRHTGRNRAEARVDATRNAFYYVVITHPDTTTRNLR